MSDIMEKPIAGLIIDARCQARERMDGETVEEYADLCRAGETPPPLEVVNVDGAHVVVDGFHRHEAALRAGVATLPVKVVGHGSMPDAVWYALSTNHRHGLKRTRADKRKAVTMALELGRDRSDREIARQVGVSHTMVSKMRRGEQLNIAPVQADPEELRQEADGDFQSGNVERARLFYEKAIAASRAQYTPLRAELAEGPLRCMEQMAPLKRAGRITPADERRCTLCGLPGCVALVLYWTRVDVCLVCLGVMQEMAPAVEAEAAE